MTRRLEDKIAIVMGAGQTPGATIGNARATAVLCAREGAHVVLVDRSLDSAHETLALSEDEGGSATAVEADATSESACKTLVDDCVAEHGRVDILHNNVGIGEGGGPVELPEEDWDKVFGVNLKSVYLALKHVLPYMEKRGSGAIINISSVLGTEVIGALSTYCASKGGLLQLNRAMALELSRYGIRVNAIAPGYIETPINSGFFKTEPGQKMVRTIPQRRLGQPDDLDGALLLLASDQGAYMTGSVVTVDGGFVLR